MNDLAQRLREVMPELGLQNAAELATFCGVSEGLVSQWFSGTTKLGPKPLRAFARTNINLDWLTDGRPPKYRIKDIFPVPHHGLFSIESNVASGPNMRGKVPLISWVQAGAFCESPDNFERGDAEKWIACPVAHGPHTYCLKVVGRSMDCEDGYREGEILFVDPDAEALPGCDVIVRSQEGTTTFKRLKQDIDGLYLLALNPNWHEKYIKLPDGAHICGVVIFSGRVR